MQSAIDTLERTELEKYNTTHNIMPFKTQLLKWIGNKQRFAHEIISYFPKQFGTYHEPFLGSGAVLGVLSPNKAEASDSFEPLIAIWKTLRDDPNSVKRWYKDRWIEFHNGDKVTQYEIIKSRYNLDANAPDFLFLTRAAYGGVIRFRKADGYMSTPCGAHQPIHFGTFSRRVDEWFHRIKGTEFFHREYADSLDRARSGDVVYCDPPYDHSQAILYGAQGFDHFDLFKQIEKAKKRGVFVALSLNGSKNTHGEDFQYNIPSNLFERNVPVNCGRSMLKRFQMSGQSLETEIVTDRLLLTH